MTTAALAFVDTETTGLDPVRHEVWEVALILRKPGRPDEELLWQLPVNLARADLIALNIGRFHERRWPAAATDPELGWRSPEQAAALNGKWRRSGGDTCVNEQDMTEWAARFMNLTWGAHIVAAVPDFDSRRLGDLLLRHGATPAWHYHLVDVETLAAGYLAGSGQASAQPPWESDDLATALGVDVAEEDRHTALGDARMARAIYDRVLPDA